VADATGDAQAGRAAKRARRDVATVPVAAEVAAGKASMMAGHGKGVTQVDPTPDGETHRYKVRCPALYWGNKKDVARVINRVDRFPPFTTVHKISKWDHFFISFPNAAAAADGVAKLALVVHKGDAWLACKADGKSEKRARAESTMRKSKDEAAVNETGVCRAAADVTAPWRHVPYAEQLERKRAVMGGALSAVTTAVWGERFRPGAVPWADALRGGQRPGRAAPPCCPLDSMVGATGALEAARDFYRNKNEFTIGFTPSSCGLGHTHHVREAAAGYSLGLVSSGEVRVGAITEDCVTTADVARHVSAAMTALVRRSKQTVYDKRAHVGYWRQVMCRHSERTGTVIVVPMVSTKVGGGGGEVCPAPGAWTDERCREEAWRAMDELFRETRYDVGLFWQVSDGMSAQSSEVPVEWVNGVRWLGEELMGMTFRVHPSAFFQVNTKMAERLYGTIGELGGLKPASVLLDICCGTGTIGLCLANRVHRVVGIEMCEPAIVDARHNAARNSVNNAVFIAGRVEDKIREALNQVPAGRECVAILDPPRAGVHNSVSTTQPSSPSPVAPPAGSLTAASCRLWSVSNRSSSRCAASRRSPASSTWRASRRTSIGMRSLCADLRPSCTLASRSAPCAPSVSTCSPTPPAVSLRFSLSADPVIVAVCKALLSKAEAAVALRAALAALAALALARARLSRSGRPPPPKVFQILDRHVPCPFPAHLRRQKHPPRRRCRRQRLRAWRLRRAEGRRRRSTRTLRGCLVGLRPVAVTALAPLALA
jgi:tRNA (uracil-5-)-methyltransferase